MKFSIAIMGHPKRQQYFGYLRDNIGICDIPILVDDGCGIHENCKKAWMAHDKKCEWHLVLNDDAIICKDFLKKAEEVLARAEIEGCEAVSFYFGKRVPMGYVAREGLKKGFVKIGTFHWGLAMCLKTKYIPEMLKFYDTQRMKNTTNDGRVAYFIRSKKIMVYYPMPSLVEHRLGESLVGDPGNSRTAYKFIDG